MKRLLLVLAIIFIVLSFTQQSHVLPFNWTLPQLANFLNLPQNNKINTNTAPQPQKLVYEESVITKVVEDSIPSVVTISINKTTASSDSYQFNPLDPFSPFKKAPVKQQVAQNIGSGFIVSTDGLIITNKHVVSDTEATYKVLTNDKKEYTVDKIYRDPLNDLAILKINASNLKVLPMGDSSTLKLGQMAVAIGTPLGEFTNTVTVGIVSGLGRGINAGSPFEGFVEKLDNVIQTDAAINPGNSGGPLLNSQGQVIGINTAIAQEGQNIGFAIPVDVIKTLIQSFEQRGSSFSRPYIGVRYQMVDRQTALLNKVVEGAYVTEVVTNSPAAKADIQVEDIITEIDGQPIKGNDEQGLAKIILQKKIGDTVSVKLWRDGNFVTKNVTLEEGS